METGCGCYIYQPITAWCSGRYTAIVTKQVQHKLLIFFLYAISANNGIWSHNASAGRYSFQISFNHKL